eukprot:UN08308
MFMLLVLLIIISCLLSCCCMIYIVNKRKAITFKRMERMTSNISNIEMGEGISSDIEGDKMKRIHSLSSPSTDTAFPTDISHITITPFQDLDSMLLVGNTEQMNVMNVVSTPSPKDDVSSIAVSMPTLPSLPSPPLAQQNNMEMESLSPPL